MEKVRQESETDAGSKNDDEQRDSDYDERELEIPGLHDAHSYEEDEIYGDRSYSYHSPRTTSQAHWLRFNRGPPIHTAHKKPYRTECNRPDCYHCHQHHQPDHEPDPDEDMMNDLQYENDSDLDKLDDAAGLEQSLSKFPRFNLNYCKVLGVSLLLVLVQHTVKVIYMCGLHRTVFNHTPGPCSSLDNVMGGSEDIVTLPDGLTFITSGYAPYATDRGRIYTYEHGSDQPPKEVRFSENFDKHRFYPHGINVWEDPVTGDIIVFCINHHPLGDRIEKFKYDKHSNMMEHLRSIIDQTIKFANNIVAIDADRFYFTNTFHSTNPHMVMLEVFLMLSWGTVVYYDGERGHIVNRGFLLNGIAISRNKQYLYVSSSGNLEIRIFRRNDHDGSIDFVQAYPIETSLDNMNVDPVTGDLWVGAQNALTEFMSHDKNPVLPCGSRIFRIKAEVEGSKLTRLTEVYANDGIDGLSGASVASYYNGSVLIGALRKPPLLCKVFI